MPQVLLSFSVAQFYSPVKDEFSPSFDAATRDTNFTWPSQQRMQRDPAHQFTGPGEDNMNIEGIIYPGLFGGRSMLDALRAIGRAGDPHMLFRYFLGDARNTATGAGPGGFIAGAIPIGGSTWVLKRVNQKDSFINSSGYADKIEFSLEFSKYGDDGFNSLTAFG